MRVLELNVTMTLDQRMEELFTPAKPFNNVPNDRPGAVSDNVTLLGPANSIMLELLKDKADKPENNRILKELLSS